MFQFNSASDSNQIHFLTFARSLAAVELDLIQGISIPAALPLGMTENRDYLKRNRMWFDIGSNKVRLEELLRSTKAEAILNGIKSQDETLARLLTMQKVIAGARQNCNFLSNGHYQHVDGVFRSFFGGGEVPDHPNLSHFVDALHQQFGKYDLTNSCEY